jgi:hypothetical protein
VVPAAFGPLGFGWVSAMAMAIAAVNVATTAHPCIHFDYTSLHLAYTIAAGIAASSKPAPGWAVWGRHAETCSTVVGTFAALGNAVVVAVAHIVHIVAYAGRLAHIDPDNWDSRSAAMHLDIGDARCRADDSSSFRAI